MDIWQLVQVEHESSLLLSGEDQVNDIVPVLGTIVVLVSQPANFE
jgi:hypothetical protein